MRSEALLNELLHYDVVEPAATGDSVSISEEFRELVEEERSALEGSLPEHLRARIEDLDVVEALCAVGEDDTEFVAYYCALFTRTENLSHDDIVRTAAVLLQFDGTPPEDEGAPDSFLPVRGDQLPTLLRLTPRAIVYTWRHNCPPCDTVKEDLDDIFEGGESDIALFAVYGPEWAELLEEEYNAVAAPTTLFVLDGEVDARLYGAPPTQAFEGEVEMLRELG